MTTPENRPQDASAEPAEAPESQERRGFLTGSLMAAGLAGGYGTAGYFGVQYLFPSSGAAKAWLFVSRVDEMRVGDSVAYKTPTGQRVAIARQGESGQVEDFVALSSTCPHLGCQVHWEAQNDRFFCPCHNGSFDPSGNPVGGPPKEADQALPRFPLRIQEGLLYIEVPVEGLTGPVAMELDMGSTPPGPGHDPCLHDRPDGEAC